VARDVVAGHVSAGEAEAVYGVVIGDPAATEARRRALRDERLRQAVLPVANLPVADADFERVGASLGLFRVGGETLVGCRCGQLLAPIGTTHKAGLGVIEEPATAAGPGVDPFRLGIGFVFRRYVCPSCARLVETEVAREGAPALADGELAAP
jgi:N-methylhydantoinase B